MVKQFIDHVDKSTPHKDRLVLIWLIAILAFTVVNTLILASNVSLAASAGSIL